MKFRHHLIFFLDDFHRGAVNHVSHFFGFFLLGYGMGKWDIIPVIISPFIMELGHFYNYLRGIHSEHAIRIIPLQWFAWLVFVAIGYVVTLYLF